MAKDAAQRQREKRERDKLSEEERQARLLSRRLVTDLYKSTDMALIRVMARSGITEPQDVVTRLIHDADESDDVTLSKRLGLS